MKATHTLLVLAAALLLLPDTADAQHRRRMRDGVNRWSFAPYAGVFKDADDIGADDEDLGWTVGTRIGYALGSRTRALVNIGYADSDDVVFSDPTAPRNLYDNQYIITTGGAEYDIIPGNTAIALGLEAGGMWRKVALDETIGTPAPEDIEDDGYTFNFVVLPGVTVRHGLSPRTAIELAFRDFIEPDDRVDHFPTLTVGMRFR